MIQAVLIEFKPKGYQVEATVQYTDVESKIAYTQTYVLDPEKTADLKTFQSFIKNEEKRFLKYLAIASVLKGTVGKNILDTDEPIIESDDISFKKK